QARFLQVPLDRPRRHACVGRGIVEAAHGLRQLEPDGEHGCADEQGGRLPPRPEEHGMKRSIRFYGLLPLAAAALLAAGCAEQVTRYGDSKGVETVTNEFGSTDLQSSAESMGRSMQTAPVIVSGTLPIVTVQEVRNRTS